MRELVGKEVGVNDCKATRKKKKPVRSIMTSETEHTSIQRIGEL